MYFLYGNDRFAVGHMLFGCHKCFFDDDNMIGEMNSGF